MIASSADKQTGQLHIAEWKSMLPYWLLALAVLLIYFHAFMGRYIDDAFITLSYASTLAKFGVWGMAPDLTSNAATSPLNVLLLAGTIKIVREPLVSVWLYQVALAVAIYCSLRYFSLRMFGNEWFALIATGLLLANPLLAATQGLESYLVIALVLLACQLWDRREYRLLGLALGALFLARPDALVVALVFAGLLLWRRQWRPLLQVAACWCLPVLPWLGYSWYNLGSLVPDTFLIKLGEGSWGGWSFRSGPLLYWRHSPAATLVSVVLAPGLLYLRKFNGPRSSLLLGLGSYACVHALLYSVLQVPPYHWYYSVEMSALVVFSALAIYEASARYRSLNLSLLGLVTVASAGFAFSTVLSKGMPAIATNWGSAGQYKEIGRWINGHISDRRISSRMELGTVQYYTDADTIDVFSDRSSIQALLLRPHGRLIDGLFKLNYQHLHVDDFSGIRYRVQICVPGVMPLKSWTIGTPFAGARDVCFYDMHALDAGQSALMQ